MAQAEESLGDFYTTDKDDVISKPRGEGILFPPELFRLDCVNAKTFLMKIYVPQLIKVICKSVFLPLKSTGGYWKVSFSKIKFLTGFIIAKALS